MKMLEYKCNNDISPDVLADLYADAGWSVYAADPEKTYRGWKQSFYRLSAWEGETLVGLLRAVGDGETILYVQDLLVRQSHQRRGIGSCLLQRALGEFSHVRQVVLLTDDTEQTRAFYSKNGLRPAEEYGCLPFVHFPF